MITALRFKRIITDSFLGAGFSKKSKVLGYDGQIGSILVCLQKSAYATRYFINVGFWINNLGEVPPSKVEMTHLYFRMESLFPAFREVIILGGDLENTAQPRLTDQLGELISSAIAPSIKSYVSSLDKIIKVYLAGGFNDGLIRKDARAFFEAESSD